MNVSLDKLCILISEGTNVSIEDIKGKKRHKHIIEARQLLTYFAQEIYDIPQRVIADFLGCDRSTCSSSLKVINNKLDTDIAFVVRYKKLERFVSPPMGQPYSIDIHKNSTEVKKNLEVYQEVIKQL